MRICLWSQGLGWEHKQMLEQLSRWSGHSCPGKGHTHNIALYVLLKLRSFIWGAFQGSRHHHPCLGISCTWVGSRKSPVVADSSAVNTSSLAREKASKALLGRWTALCRAALSPMYLQPGRLGHSLDGPTAREFPHTKKTRESDS